jgi:hypothetical protein
MAEVIELGNELEMAVRARLLAAPAIQAVANLRVDWGFRPAPPLPALVLEVVTDIRPHHFQDRQGLRETRVQVDAWGKTRTEAKRLALLTINALEPSAQVDIQGSPGHIPGMATGVRFERSFADGPEPSTESTETGVIHRARFDIMIWWALTAEGEAQ